MPDPFAPPTPTHADGHHLARGAAANTLVLLAANFRAIFTFLIARLLGEAALGRFGLVFSLTELLSKAGMLGLDQGMVPLVATRAGTAAAPALQSLLHRAVLVAGAASAALALLAIPGVSWLADRRGLDAFTGWPLVMLLALPGIAVARISTGASRGVLSMRDELYSRGFTETWVTIGVFVAAIALGIREAAPALAVVAGVTAAATVAFALASRALAASTHTRAAMARPLQEQAEPVSTFEMLRFSAPIAGSSLLNVLVMQIDILLLGAFVGRAPGVTVASFGVYCAVAEVAGGMRKVRQIFDPVFAPIVAARAASSDRARLRETVAAPGRWVLAAQLPLVGLLVLAGGVVLSLYGPAFRQGTLWLALLAVAHGSNSFAGLVETLLMVERPAINLFNSIVTLAVQVTAALVLIPAYGATGAALAMVIGFGVQGVLRFTEVSRVFGWVWPWQSLVRPAVAFAAALVPAGALRMAGSGVAAEVGSAGVFIAVYLLAWRVMGADPADRAVWRRLRGIE